MSDIVPIVPMERGNIITLSKQIAPSKRWCFTLNNPEIDEISNIVLVCKGMTGVFIIGSEVGENGTPHLQGYVEFIKNVGQ